jgi:hypothetical protein
MNAHKFPAARSPVGGTAPIPTVPANGIGATPIGAAEAKPVECPTEGAGAPFSLTYSDDGWGSQPRCITCRKGISNCYCDAPDIEDMAAGDVSRIMGWELAERSAFGMVKL